MTELRVLLTGFGPFPGTPDNSSAWLADSFATRTGERSYQLHAEVLPTEWDAVARILPSLLDTLKSDIALHFGVSPRTSSFRIERFAHNEMRARADAAGMVPDRSTIVAGGAIRLATRLPASDLAGHLCGCGMRASPSGCAGRYLCNFLYYLSLDWAARQESPCLAAFVHMPPLPADGGPFSEVELLRAAEQILGFLVAFASERDRTIMLQARSGPELAAWNASAAKGF
ncbi:MAG: pyroglutamyl-peptidase I [Methyloceanibacter sp.]|uniref:pyroglutamyl-peptidase I family protein n=1 Tax=Methyloceanibacter sp. TaxID=1965321 RepID=UPI003D9B2E8A